MRASRPEGGLLWALAFLSLALLGWAGSAQAAAYQIDARTEAQAYQIRSFRGTDPSNLVLLPRRRLVQYLGLNVYEIVTGEDLSFESNLRLYSDLGVPRGEAAVIDGAHAEGVDLLSANLGFRRGGWEAKLGRQVYTDILDYMAFDGVKVRYMSRYWVGAELYGGLWVKGANLLGSTVYQPDGTRESDARRLGLGAPGADPVLDDLEPMFGAKLLAQSPIGLSGDVGYRKAILAGKTDLERMSVQVRYNHVIGITAQTGLDIDLMLAKLAQLRSEVRYTQPLWGAGIELLRLAPVLSAESIWYYFATAPRDELNLRGDITPPGPLRFYVRLTASKYNLNLHPDAQSDDDPTLLTGDLNLGGSVGAALALSGLHSGLDLTTRHGSQGQQLWVDFTVGWSPENRRYSIDGRFSYARVGDSYRPELRGSFIGEQLWGSYELGRGARVSLALEHNVNPISKGDFKVFGAFDLRALL